MHDIKILRTKLEWMEILAEPYKTMIQTFWDWEKENLPQ